MPKRHSKADLVLEAAVLEAKRSPYFPPHLAMSDRPARTAAGRHDYRRLNGGSDTPASGSESPEFVRAAFGGPEDIFRFLSRCAAGFYGRPGAISVPPPG